MNRNKKIILSIGCAFMALVLSSCGTKDKENKKNEEEVAAGGIEALLHLDKKQNPVTKEEYQFYKDQLSHDTSEEEVRQQIIYNRSEFFLAKLLGTAQYSSFEDLKKQWWDESKKREEKQEKNEVVYGKKNYDFPTWLAYYQSNLHIRNIEALAEMKDKDLLSQARGYYTKHENDYRSRREITCRLSNDKKSEDKVFTYNDIRSLQKTDEEMFRFFMDEKQGGMLKKATKNGEVTIEILEVKEEVKKFEDIEMTVLQDYLGQEYYDKLISRISDCYPVTFKD